MNGNRTVKKESAEEKTLLANIASQLAELRAMEEAEGAPKAEMADEEGREALPPEGDTEPIESMDEEPMEKEDEEEEKKVASKSKRKARKAETPEEEAEEEAEKCGPKMRKARKDIQASDSDSATAEDDAEDRIDEMDPDDAASLEEVTKALAKLITRSRGRKPVRKSMSPMEGLVSALTSVVSEQKRQRFVMDEMLSAFGVTKSIEPKPATRRPVQTLDSDAVLDALLEAAQSRKAQKSDDTANPRAEVRKSLSSVMGSLWGVSQKE